MKTNSKPTKDGKDSSSTARAGGGLMAVTLSVALVLLTVVSSLIVSTGTTGAAPVDPGKGVEEPLPESVTDDVALLPQVLTATLEFRCRDQNGAYVFATVTNHSPSHQKSFTFEVQGPEVSYKTPAGVAPGSTAELNHFAGVNGDPVNVWIRDDAGTTLAHAKLTVECGKPDPGQPDPWVTIELVCKNPHAADVVVNMGNDGSAPVVFDVFFSLASLQGADQVPASRTVDPGESQAIEFSVDEGQTYSARVYVQGQGGSAFAEQTITVDCIHGSTPPTNPAGSGAPRFTG
jgi:hypothetical protein